MTKTQTMTQRQAATEALLDGERTEAVIEQVLALNEPLARWHARRWPTLDYHEIAQAARVGIWRAAVRFDRTRGPWGPWAWRYSQSEVVRFVHGERHPHLSLGAHTYRHHVLRAADRVGRDPDAILDRLDHLSGLTRHHVTVILDEPKLRPLDAPITDGKRPTLLVDTLADPEPGPDSALVAREDRDADRGRLVGLLERAELTERQLEVVIRHWGLDDEEPETYDQIAQRLGAHHQAVSMSGRRALERLEAASRGETLQPGGGVHLSQPVTELLPSRLTRAAAPTGAQGPQDGA